VGEFDFSINSSWSEQSWVEDIDSVGGHNNFDCLGGFESVKLIEQLKHSSLHFRVASLSVHPRASDRIDLIDEDNAGRMLTCHNEEFSHHSGSLSDVFLDKF